MSRQTTCYPNSKKIGSLQELSFLLSFLINLLVVSNSVAHTPHHPKLLFLGNKNIAPVVYLDNGIPSGVAVDIVHALEKHLSQPVEIKAMDWSEAQALVAGGEADALIQINSTEERIKIYDFSDTLLESQFSIFTTTNRVGISGASSLRGLRVGVEAGGLPKLVLEKDPLIQLTIIPNFLEGFKLLTETTLDAVVVDYRVGSYILAENRIRNIKVTGEPVAFSFSSFAVKKGDVNLLAEINNALRIIKADGTYQGILDKWKPKEGIFYSREQITRLIFSASVFVLLIVFLIVVTWMVTLKKELTQKKAAEESLRRMNRELRAVSSCNQVLIRSEDEQGLLNDICRIICDEAGYCMAWVGYVEDDDAKIVRPVAWAGNEDGYLVDANISWADTERGRGPTGTAIRSGKSACIQDFAIDPLVALWREKALLRGYRANIALPLQDESAKTFGALTIYSTEPNTFTIDEIHLLEELADDLAFGIMVLRSRVEHRRAEDALYDAQQVFRVMVENSPDIIARYDRECRRTYVNPTYLAVAEISLQELLATTPLQHSPLPAVCAVEHQNLLNRVLNSGHAEAVDILWPRTDNTDFWYNVYAFPEFDREGRVMSVMTVFRDITERKRAEEEIRLLNQELEQRVAERTAELELKSIELQDSRNALMNIVEDLNEKTTQLEQVNARLKELDQLKSMFIASMSHELRTPLNSIIGFSSIMLNEWAGPLNAEQKENIAAVLRSGKHLLSLINDVIDVSKIETGKIESIVEEFDVHEVVLEAVETIKKDIEKKGLELIVRAPRRILHADRRRLLQCLLNLLSNAAKFTNQGSIGVYAELSADGSMMTISVEDTGIGISEKDLGKLFSPFVRLHAVGENVIPGTGLGLYLTRKLLWEILKGDILVSSTSSAGSRFAMRVPINA